MVQRYKFESKSQHTFFECENVWCCFQWFKGTNLRANHNVFDDVLTQGHAVSNGSKVQIWEQITTVACRARYVSRCFQWFKGTNLRANHNRKATCWTPQMAVSNGSKVQIWEQITTNVVSFYRSARLFPMVQRYKFESKSQLPKK